jgi:diguanylate cyclase (GGDEF)-like protein
MIHTERGARLAGAGAATMILALLVVPFLFQRHVADLRAEITDIVEPAREASGRIQLALTREIAALRGYLIVPEPHLLEEYARARSDEQALLARLLASKPPLDPEIVERLTRLQALSSAWNQRNQDLAEGRLAVRDFIPALSDQRERFAAVLSASAAVDEALAVSSQRRRARIARAEQTWAFSTAALTLLAVACVAIIAFALRASRTHAEEARTDVLTGLLNRMGFLEGAERELRRAERYGAPVTVICFDLDGFKAVNDEEGHEAGDRVLQAVAHALQTAVRTVDPAARMGGDEFAILLADNRAQPPEAAAFRIRDTIMERLREDQSKVTLSMGAVTVPAGGLLPDLLHDADELMYEAKRGGKNAVRHRTHVHARAVG